MELSIEKREVADLPGSVQTEGLKESSRVLSAHSADTPGSDRKYDFDPEGVTGWHPYGCKFLMRRSGGLRFASTPGYILATLRVVNRTPKLSRNYIDDARLR